MTITKIAEKCWGVTEESKNYPGHIFPTKRLAQAFVENKCPCCWQTLAQETAKEQTTHNKV
jgi:hypothetical protein